MDTDFTVFIVCSLFGFFMFFVSIIYRKGIHLDEGWAINMCNT